MFRINLTLLSLIALLAMPIDTKAEVAATWEESIVLVPKSATKSGENIRFFGRQVADEALGKIKAGKKLPAVVYLHGCSGFGVLEAWGILLQGLDVAVFAPDSFARPNRKVFCKKGQMPRRMKWRLEEAAYIRAQLRDLQWVDNDRVILMGFSEGGQSAADYNGDEYVARIIIGADCRHQGGSPNNAADTPFLNIVGSRDHYDQGEGCSDWFSPDGSRALILEGAGHDVSAEPAAIRAVIDFLFECCGIRAAEVEFSIADEASKLIEQYGDLATVFAFQNSEDAINNGDIKRHQQWLEVKEYIDAKISQ